MKVHELVATVSFADVTKELLITNRRYKDKLTDFFVYFQNLKSAENSGLLEATLVIDRDSFDRCYLVDFNCKSIVHSGVTYLAVGDYLNANVGEWEMDHLSPSLIVAALLVTLTEEGTCFTEEDRMGFARKLYWHSYGVQVEVNIDEPAC